MNSNKIVRAIVARFDLEGNIDSKFNNGKGFTLGTGFGPTKGMYIAQSPEHICISGWQREEPPVPPWATDGYRVNLFALKLNQSDGSMYTPFGGIGLCVRPLPDPHMGISSDTGVGGMVLTEDGKVSLCEQVWEPSVGSLVVFVRLTDSGAFDHTFGISGVVLERQTNFGLIYCVGLVRMPSGGLITSFMKVQELNKLHLIHYDSPSEDAYHSIADFGLQYGVELSPRRICGYGDHVYVAGSHKAQDGSNNYFVARLDGAGQPDPSFGVGGLVVSKFGEANVYINALQVTHSGIYLAGLSRPGKGILNTLALAKYTLSGARDITFSGDGKRLVSYESIKDLSVTSLAVSTDGTIYVGGGAKQKVFLAAFKANGDTLDNFGQNTLPIERGTLLFDNFDRPDDADPSNFYCISLALSPNGKHLVFCGYSTEVRGLDFQAMKTAPDAPSV